MPRRRPAILELNGLIVLNLIRAPFLRKAGNRPFGIRHGVRSLRFLDEVFVSINGRQLYVWRAVDSEPGAAHLAVKSFRARGEPPPYV